MLCEYKNLLGIPGQGIHTHFYGIAYMDVLMTMIGSIILSILFNIHPLIIFIALFLTGIFIHRALCIRTTVDKFLFP